MLLLYIYMSRKICNTANMTDADGHRSARDHHGECCGRVEPACDTLVSPRGDSSKGDFSGDILSWRRGRLREKRHTQHLNRPTDEKLGYRTRKISHSLSEADAAQLSRALLWCGRQGARPRPRIPQLFIANWSCDPSFSWSGTIHTHECPFNCRPRSIIINPQSNIR